MYDGDSAGLHAAVKAITLILKEGMNPKVVFLPDGDDPDSFSRKHTLEEIQAYIREHEKDGILFKTDLLLEEAGGDPLKKANLINEIADTVADIPDTIKRTVYIDEVARKFDIEADIIQERVSRTREANRLSEHKRDSLTATQQGGRPEAAGDDRGQSPLSGDSFLRQEEQILLPSERELLGFILQHGRTELKFETDSEFHHPEGEEETVAEFIDAALAPDDIRFANKDLQDTYEAYFAHYDEGMDQNAIVLALMNGEDRRVAAVAEELSTEKYLLSVHNFSDALTTTDSWLVTYVPKSILVYYLKRVDARQLELSRQLKTASSAEEANSLMRQLSVLNTSKKNINIKLGRLPK